MSSVILTNWTAYYADDAGANAGYKQIRWTGAGAPETNTNTVNELYSALADLFSIAAQNNANDTIPIQAVTPTVYNIGSFDAGDLEPWFIDPVSITHLTGGSLQTVGWERSFGGSGDIGIVKITRSGSTNIVEGDIGATITNTTGGDDGWLLYIEGNTLWIRPATNGTGDDWNTTGGSGDLVCNGHTDTQATAGVSGEKTWSNIFSLGTLVPGTTLDVYQNDTQIPPFWSSGHLDRLFLVNDGFASGEIDSGNLAVLARKYGTLYDHYVIDASSGRNPVPLAAFADTNNETAEGTVAVAPYSDLTFDFGSNTSYDIDGDTVNEAYDVVINCSDNTIEQVYEYLKYICRTGSATTFTGYGSIPGEYYTAVGDIRFTYNNLVSGPFVEGNAITDTTSGATGYITSLIAGSGTLVIRNTHGTFTNGDALSSAGTTATINSVPSAIAPSKQAPFGTFAGGRFFGARGVLLINVALADANSFELIDSTGTTRTPPETINLTINITDADGNAITGAPGNCEVTVVKDSDGTVLFTEDNITDGITTYTYTTDAGTLTYINVLNVAGYQPRTVSNYTLPSGSTTLSIQLDADRFYST